MIDEPGQPATPGVVAVALPEQRQGARGREHLAEDAGRAQQAPGRGRHRLDASLDHAEHGLGQAVVAARGVGADELLQVEGVARRLIAEARQVRRRDGRVEGAGHQLLRGAPRERAQAYALHAALAPEVGEDVVHLGPGQGEHHQGLVLEIAQRLVDELDSRRRRPSAGPRARGASGSPCTRRGGRRRRRAPSPRPCAPSSAARRRGARRPPRRGRVSPSSRRGTSPPAAPRGPASSARSTLAAWCAPRPEGRRC